MRMEKEGDQASAATDIINKRDTSCYVLDCNPASPPLAHQRMPSQQVRNSWLGSIRFN